MYIKNYSQIEIGLIIKRIDLIIPAGDAKLTPPVGPILGQAKIKVKDFCVSFNEITKSYPLELPLRVLVFVFKNDKFNFLIRSPSVSFFLKNHILINANKEISILDLYKISLLKKKDFDHLSLNSIYKNVVKQAKLFNMKLINFHN